MLCCAVAEADLVGQARLRAGRALAWEGLSEWRAAIADYDDAMALAARAGCAHSLRQHACMCMCSTALAWHVAGHMHAATEAARPPVSDLAQRASEKLSHSLCRPAFLAA